MLDWLATSGAGGGVRGNLDGDTTSNLAEFALGMHPARPDVPEQELTITTRSGQPAPVVQFPSVQTRNGYLLVTPRECSSPAGPWTNVPSSRFTRLPGGGLECRTPLANGRAFLRLAITPAP